MKVHFLKIKEEYAKETYLGNKMFEITYITDYEQKRGFVVFGEKEVTL